MARKSNAVGRGPGGNRDRYLAFLGYQMGHAGVWFPALAVHLWQTTSLGEPGLPPGLRRESRRLADVAQRLGPLIKGRGADLSARVAKAVERAWACLEGAWGGELHRSSIEHRDETDPDFCALEEMLKDSPFTDPVWEHLRRVVEEYSEALPRPVRDWTRLGAATARVFDPRSGGTPGSDPVVALENEMAAMRPHPLLDGLPLDLSRASLEEIGALHDQLRGRLAGAGWPGNVPASGATPGQRAGGEEESMPAHVLTDDIKALAWLMHDPEMSDAEIARRVPCNRTSLYRMKLFPLAKEVLLKSTKGNRPRGIRSRDRAGNMGVDATE
jgi:hypothetical protein